MTLTVIDPVGSFSCKKCKLTFEGTYKPQQRPRKSCPSCHKMCGMTVVKSSKTRSTTNPKTPQEGVTDGDPLTQAKLSLMSIKAKLKLLGETAVDEYILTRKESRVLTEAIRLLSREEFIDQGEVIDGVYWNSDTPPYKRPEFMYDHQQVAMLLMDIGHLLWQASRQLAGKTTAAFLKDCEDMLKTPHTIIALVAPTVPLAVDVLFKFLYNPPKDENGTPIKVNGHTFTFYELFKPYILGDPNQLGFYFKNGSELKIKSLNIAGSQGRSIDVIHIEEIDKLGTEQSKRIALAGIINSIRANPNAKIRINSNNATGIFRLLKQELFKYGRYFSIYLEDPFLPGEKYTGKHTIINENVIVDKIPVLDDILKIFSEVLVSYAFAEGQLYNIDDVTDETFNPDKVEIAYNSKHDIDDYYVRTTMGIDPGGKVDAFGCSIWSLTKSGKIELRWCKRFYNALHTAKQQAKEIAEVYLRYNVEEIEYESSAGGAWSISLIKDEVYSQSNGKIRVKSGIINFEGEGKVFSKSNFCYLFKILLDYEYLILKETNDEERMMHHQITKYIPNKSESNNNPDDLIESGFHGTWVLVGGLNYIKTLIDLVATPVAITTGE